MKLVVSVHDCAPLYLPELTVIFSALNDIGIMRKTILVTPNWQEQYDIRQYPSFISLLQELEHTGSELALHGYAHKITMDQPIKTGLRWNFLNGFEFYRARDIPRRLAIALRLFEETFGHKPRGFIPPMWVANRTVRKLLQDNGIAYTCTLLRVTNLSTNKFITTAPINHDCGSLGLSRLGGAISRIFAPLFSSQVVRISIHPEDVRRGLLTNQLDLIRMYLAHGFIPTTYASIAECL